MSWTMRPNKTAVIELIKGFMIRHKKLSFCKPENTSLSRATRFSCQNLNEFQINSERVLCKSKFSPKRIFNIDETSIMTVVQATNIRKRQKIRIFCFIVNWYLILNPWASITPCKRLEILSTRFCSFEKLSQAASKAKKKFCLLVLCSPLLTLSSIQYH